MEDWERIKEQKEEFRRAARQKQKTITPQEAADWGNAMLHHLKALPLWENAQTILCFMSMPGEPDTDPILRQILHEHRTLCLPRQTGTPGWMQAHKVAGLFALQPGPHGILEPPERMEVVEPESIDLILAPCLAATAEGVRLGHGGGYYDRFFARSKAARVVLCPSRLLFHKLPQGPFDQLAQIVVTENGIL